jgi:hypothetical protein
MGDFAMRKLLCCFTAVFATLLLMSSAKAEYTNITGCTVISSSGEYRLNQSFTDTNTNAICIEIASNDVTLDGQGYKIDSSVDVQTIFTIDSYYNNTVIKNFNVSNVSICSGCYYSGVGSIILVDHGVYNLSISNNNMSNFTKTGWAIWMHDPHITPNSTYLDLTSNLIQNNITISGNNIGNGAFPASQVYTDPYGRWEVNSTGTPNACLYLQGINVVVANNTITNCTSAAYGAISLDDTFNISIYGNVLSGNGYGIIANAKSTWNSSTAPVEFVNKNISVYNNTITNCYEAVYFAQYQRGLDLENNTITNCGVMIEIRSHPSEPTDTKKDVIIRGNVVSYGIDSGGGITIRNATNINSYIIIDNNTFTNATGLGALKIRLMGNRTTDNITFTNNYIYASNYEGNLSNAVIFSGTYVQSGATALWTNGSRGFEFRADGAGINNTVSNMISCNNTITGDDFADYNWINVLHRESASQNRWIHLYNVMNINSSSCSPYISLIVPTIVNFGYVSAGSNYSVGNITKTDTNLIDTKISMSNGNLIGLLDTINSENLTYYANWTTSTYAMKNPVTLTLYRRDTLENDYYNFNVSIPSSAYAGIHIGTFTETYAANSQPMVDYIYHTWII